MVGLDTVKLDFTTLDVFTGTRFLGNPLAVVFVPPALRERLDQATKQRIAREFNLSETVFLHMLENEPNRDYTAREIDIFTIDEELPFAGHPTIGSAYLVLHQLGWSHVNTLLTKAGPIHIEALGHGGAAVRAAIPHAVHIHQQTLGKLLESPFTAGEAASAIKNGLSADSEIREAELAAPAVSIVKGMTFLLVRLPSLAHLARALEAKNRLDFSQIPDLLDRGEWHKSFVARYYYVPMGSSPSDAEDGSKNFELRTRMVELGFEDPATGSAASTLASYLAIREKAEKGAQFAITQGVEMGRRSEIAVDVVAKTEAGSSEVQIKEVYLGGTAVVVMSGRISV